MHDIALDTETSKIAIYYRAGKENISPDTLLSICQSILRAPSYPSFLPHLLTSAHTPTASLSSPKSSTSYILSTFTLQVR